MDPWQNDPITAPANSNAPWQNDPIAQAPKVPDTSGVQKMAQGQFSRATRRSGGQCKHAA